MRVGDIAAAEAAGTDRVVTQAFVIALRSGLVRATSWSRASGLPGTTLHPSGRFAVRAQLWTRWTVEIIREMGTFET